MAEVFDFDPTDANNVARWPEGMLGGQINNAGRADEGILGRWYRDTNGSVVSSNVGNAFSITSNRVISSLLDNLIMVFTANITSNGPATLNLNGLGARAIKRFNLTELAVGDIISNTPIAVLFKQAHNTWFMTNAPAALVTNMFGDFSENAAPGNPAVNVARVYAVDQGSSTKLAYRDSAGVQTVLGPGELVAIIEDRKAQNTSGGTFTAGSDQVRDLNTTAFIRDTLVSLAANRFTITPGTWEIEWSAPGHQCDQHQSFLFNVTDATEVARGSCAATNNTLSFSTRSVGSARVSIAASKAFELRHRCSSTRATNGFGQATNLSTEVYSRVVVRRA